MRTVLLGLVLLLSSCSLPLSQRVAIGTSILDVGTTAYALDRGYSEGNPLWDYQYGQQLNISLTVALHWGLHKADNPYASWAYAIVRGLAGAHNLYTIMR